MAKLRRLSGREIAAILRRHGFVDVRQRGSHLHMRGTVENRPTIVTVPQHRQVKLGTLHAIIKKSGVPRSEFE